MSVYLIRSKVDTSISGSASISVNSKNEAVEDPFPAKGSSEEVRAKTHFWSLSSSFPALSAPFDKKKWETHFYCELQRVCKLQFCLHDETQTTLDEIIETKGISMLPLKGNLESAFTKDPKDYLKPFLVIESPDRFVKCQAVLYKKEVFDFYDAIGGKEVIKFLETFFGKKNRPALERFFESFLLERQTSLLVESKQADLPAGFDELYPISVIYPESIVNSFRFLYPAFSDNSSLFKLNGSFLEIPIQSGVAELERQQGIFSTLIAGIEEAFELESKAYDPEKQAELLCQRTLLGREKFEIKLVQAFKNEPHEPSLFSVETLSRYQVMIGFRKWLSAQDMAVLLGKLEETDSETAASAFARQYNDARVYEMCEEYIPCYRLLQALSFNAYGSGAVYLQQELFPQLFHAKDGIPKLKGVPTEPTRFEISKKEGGRFLVTQIKPYHFVVKQSENIRIIGSMKAFWTLSGSFDSKIFHAHLRCGEMKFIPGSEPKLCEQAMNMLEVYSI